MWFRNYNRRLGRGEAVYSHPHRFVLALTYQSHWGKTLPALPKALLESLAIALNGHRWTDPIK